MKLDREYLYKEGDWFYYRVLVDGEQVGFIAVNRKIAKVGLAPHYRYAYPNDEVMQALIVDLSKFGREYALNRPDLG